MTAFWHRFTKGWKQKEEKKGDETRLGADVTAPASTPAGVGGAASAHDGAKDEIAPHSALLRVHTTEQATHLERMGQYVFRVPLRATKGDIVAAMRQGYQVHPQKVNVIKVRGKAVRFGRMAGERSDWKKAIVTLKKGDAIALHKGV